jgi:hypothetical protein
MQLAIQFDTTWNPKRLHVSGSFPLHRDGRVFSFGSYEHIQQQHPDTSITVAWDRDAAIIAKEIERRLMPDYTVLFAEAQNRIEATELERIAKNERIKSICQLLGVPFNKEWLAYGSYPEIGSYKQNRRVKVNGTLTYELRLGGLTSEELEQFIKLHDSMIGNNE